MNETEIKYLSGLLDADGSLFLNFVPYKDQYNVRLTLVLQQSLSIDKDGKYMQGLSESFNKKLQVIEFDNPNWSNANRLSMTNRTVLNKLLPRVVKHMVIKAKHWSSLMQVYDNIYGKTVSEKEMLELKEFSSISRKNTGPLKDKKHPTWAWVAGYIDGDGCYYMRTRKKNNRINKELLVRVVAHDHDTQGLDLLHKAFGGRLRKERHENTHSWTKNLGPQSVSFAKSFLKKMHKHSKLKKYKIEQMLHYHSQRLSDNSSTEQAIV